jgi:hypothetical protein
MKVMKLIICIIKFHVYTLCNVVDAKIGTLLQLEHIEHFQCYGSVTVIIPRSVLLTLSAP